MKPFDLYDIRKYALVCFGLMGFVLVSCGSGDVIDASDSGTDEGLQSLQSEMGFEDVLSNSEKLAGIIEKCKSDPSSCDVGELPSASSSSSAAAGPGSSSSASVDPGSSSSADSGPGSSSSSRPFSSSSSVIPPSSSSVSPPSSSSSRPSSSSSSVTPPSSSSVLPPSSSSSAPNPGEGDVINLSGTTSVTLTQGVSYTVNNSCPNKIAFTTSWSSENQTGAIDVSVNGETVTGSYYAAANAPGYTFTVVSNKSGASIKCE